MRAGGAVACLIVTGLAGGDEGKSFQPGGDDQPLHGDAGIGEEIVEAGEQARLAGEREPDRALRICIDEQGIESSACESVGEVDGKGGFTHSSLLAGDGDADHAA